MFPIFLFKYRHVIPLLLVLYIAAPSNAYKIAWNNEWDIDSKESDKKIYKELADDLECSREPEDEMRSLDADFSKLMIFPGTKWCGKGNKAHNDADLGKFKDTDACCRTHDKCPDSIEAYGEKYNLTNNKFYTRSHCECDRAFYKCLRSVNTAVSNTVGHKYFTLLSTQCYRKDFPISGCRKYTKCPTPKCVEYELNRSQQMKYQWFDQPDFIAPIIG